MLGTIAPDRRFIALTVLLISYCFSLKDQAWDIFWNRNIDKLTVIVAYMILKDRRDEEGLQLGGSSQTGDLINATVRALKLEV